MASKLESINASVAHPIQETAAMDNPMLAQLMHTLQTAAVAALIFAICAYVPKFKRKAQLGKIPTLSGLETGEKQRQAFLSSAKKMYIDGHNKVSHLQPCRSILLTLLLVQRLCIQNCGRGRYVNLDQAQLSTIAHTPSGEENVVVPLSLLPELRKLPDDVLSFPEAVKNVSGH
jgi:hypothetical protein